MAGGGGGAGGATYRELDETPTWAVSLVCAIIIVISILLEKSLNLVGNTFSRRKKIGLLQALEKIKAELMILGFISLTLTFGQNFITQICIAEKYANTMLPCNLKVYHPYGDEETHGAVEHLKRLIFSGEGRFRNNQGDLHRRRVLWDQARRVLAGASSVKECKKGFVPLISSQGLHQLHIFIFFLAVFHVIYSASTMGLGRMKIRCWKEWERESEKETIASTDPSKYRLTHETSFVRGHNGYWTQNPFLFHVGCFFRHMFRSVRKADYLTLRHGFISVHLAPGTKFNFQKYIKRSLDDDFKVIVGIHPVLWFASVVYLLVNVKGWQAMFWLSIMPLVIILAVGTKLESVITKMAIEIQERNVFVQGIPIVEVSDAHFWFHWPEFILHLIHLILFQNAFEITYFIWITYEFGLYSCYHSYFGLTVIRVLIGVGVQFLCSYSTLPLYALVTQMGSNMKMAIFDEQTSKALKNWHRQVKKRNESMRLGSRRSDSDSLRFGSRKSGELSVKSMNKSPDRDSVDGNEVPLPGECAEPSDPSGHKDLLTGPL